MKTTTSNNLDQLTSAVTGSSATGYGYDADGNRITRTRGGATDTYAYDAENRLVSLTKNTAGGAGTYSYQYDYRTRRIGRTENGADTAVVFSGGTSVREYDGTPGGAPTVQYVRGSDYGGGIGGILYTLRSPGGVLTPSYTHENRRGDVIAKTGDGGTLTYQAQYEGFGARTQEHGSTQDRQKANTKDEDPTGLLNEGFRYRDLETGSFITRDPAGFVDGPNLYTYVVQNPWTKFDPEGLATEDDYNKDLQNQQAQENQAIKDYDKKTPKDQRTQDGLNAVEKPFEDKMAGDRHGISEIEATAKYMRQTAEKMTAWYGSDGGLAKDADHLDDSSATFAAYTFDRNYESGGSLIGMLNPGTGAESGIINQGERLIPGTVIGRVKDLQNLGPGEESLLSKLPDLGDPKANWYQNSSVLRQAMSKGNPIRDASPGNTGGQFLNAERNLLQNKGWTLDPKTNYWMPPKQ